MSNTSKGPGQKGSKYWMQRFVNTKDSALLNSKIHKEDSTIKGLIWRSPLQSGSYSEFRARDIPNVKPEDIAFWPSQGPWWDAVATFDNEGILLVEAKAHRREVMSHCTAKSPDSIRKIKSALRYTHDALAPGQAYDKERENIWFTTYYQLANRLAFLHHLRAEGKNVRLLLLNFVNDTTHIPTKEQDWRDHSEKIWMEMLGSPTAPKGVLEIFLEV